MTITFEGQLLPRNDGRAFDSIVTDGILNAKEFLWVTSAITRDFKIYSKRRRKPVIFSEVIKALRDIDVEIKILLSTEREDWRGKEKALYHILDDEPGIEFRFCNCIHMKVIIVDGIWLYFGSANLTGAGLGVSTWKGQNNFEVGVITEDKPAILEMAKLFTEIWLGKHCKDCYRRKRGQCRGIKRG